DSACSASSEAGVAAAADARVCTGTAVVAGTWCWTVATAATAGCDTSRAATDRAAASSGASVGPGGDGCAAVAGPWMALVVDATGGAARWSGAGDGSITHAGNAASVAMAAAAAQVFTRRVRRRGAAG